MLKHIPFRHIGLCALLFCVCAAVSIAQNNPLQLTNDLNDKFEDYELISLSPKEISASVRKNGRFTLTVNSQRLDFVVAPHNLFSPDYRAEETTSGGTRRQLSAPQITTFKGKVSGDESSEVRLTLSENKIEGLILRGGERLFIEPARRFSRSAGADEFVLYDSTDIKQETALYCDLPLENKIESAAERFVPENAEPNSLSTTVLVAEIATEADFQFVTTLGGATTANAEIVSILNMVEGTFQRELNLVFSVTYQHAWSTADPYPASDTQAALLSFQSYWNTNFPVGSFPRDMAHLFSGKPTIAGQGRAFQNVVCRNPGAAYGITGRFDYELLKFALVAHELAHNLGAAHAEATQGCQNTLMNSTLTQFTPLSFCPVSRGEVGSFINSNNSCLSTRTLTPTRFDFDGDARADAAVFRPSNGGWYVWRSGSSSLFSVQFGQAGDRPVTADYDGDRIEDVAVYRAGNWYILQSQTNTFRAAAFGMATDVPAPADFSGDGRSDIAVFRPSTGGWYILNLADNSFNSAQFGMPGDIPVAGDYDSDRRADIAIFRPTNGGWYRLNSSSGSFVGTQFGAPGDVPVPANYEGGGKTVIAVFRPSNGGWYIQNPETGGVRGVQFGNSADVPVPADYDGDGTADIAVYRPTNGSWYRLNSSNGAFTGFQFGAVTDIPVQAR